MAPGRPPDGFDGHRLPPLSAFGTSAHAAVRAQFCRVVGALGAIPCQPCVVREPALRAILDTDDTYDDPSEDALFELLSDIAQARALWVIVEKVAAADGQTYAQTIRLDDGSFQVERRRGGPDTHETVSGLDMRSAHARLTEWSFRL